MRKPHRLLTTLCAAAALGQNLTPDQLQSLTADDRITVYEALAGAEPEDLRYRNLLATGYLQKFRQTADRGMLEHAGKVVESVLSEDRNNYQALRLRSEIGLERREFARVVQELRRLIQIAPTDAWNWGVLGDALMQLGQYDEAADAYQKMVTLRPGSASYLRAARFHFVAGDGAGAIELMKLAVAASEPFGDNRAWCLVELGDLYFKAGRLQEAESAYRSALRAFPGYPAGHAGIGRVRAAEGHAADAVASYRQAQASAPSAEYAGALAVLYQELGDGEEARKQRAWMDASERTPDVALIIAYADADLRLDRALELAREERNICGNPYAHDALAWALYKNRRYGEAGREAAEALKMNTPEPQFHYHAGLIAAALGKKADAIQHLEQALSLNPKFDRRQAAAAARTLADLRKEQR